MRYSLRTQRPPRATCSEWLGRPALAGALACALAGGVGCAPQEHAASQSESDYDPEPAAPRTTGKAPAVSGPVDGGVVSAAAPMERRPGQLSDAHKPLTVVESHVAASDTLAARAKPPSTTVSGPDETPAVPRAPKRVSSESKAEQILANFFHRYLVADSYQDSGMVEERRGESVAKASFTTKYQRRTGEFLLKHIALERRYVVVRNAAGVTHVDDSAAETSEQREDLIHTLTIAKRLTKSVSVLLPSLLFPQEMESVPTLWTQLGGFDRRKPERVRDVKCERLRASSSQRTGTHVDLWIDDDFVLHRLRLTESEIGRVTTWNFYPKFDVRFGPKAFAMGRP